jgi:ribose transport system substrate-binding protein
MPGPALTFVGSDDVAIGRAVAQALIAGIGGKGRIVALDGTPSARTARDRGDGLRRAVAEHPGVELIDSRVGTCSARRPRRRWTSCSPAIRGSTACGPPTT